MDVTGKCETEGCLYKKHSNIANNNGNYCCRSCMKRKNRRHGPFCERLSTFEISRELNKQADEMINKIVMLVEENSAGGKRHYRVCDIVKHKGVYWKESTDFIVNNNRFEGSILLDYIKKDPHKNKNGVNSNYVQILSEIVQNKVKDNLFDVPDKNELVVHLRLGDYVEKKGKFLKKDYVKLIKGILLKNTDINKITICTAFHYGNNVAYNAWIYTDKKHQANLHIVKALFIKLLKNINLPFSIRSSQDIDSDFVYMVEAKHFIKDVGGFSNLIQEIVDYRNTGQC
jgi:hypothetical protein